MPSQDAHTGEAHNLRSRSVVLHPVRPQFFEFLCEMALTGEVPWQWNGRPESADSFRETLGSGVLCQYVPVSRSTGQPIGLIRLTAANFFHGHAYISVYFSERYRRTSAVAESLILLLDHAFRRYGLRKIYAETLQPYLENISSGEHDSFEVEARFRDYAFFEGRYVDKLVLTIDGVSWAEKSPFLLKQISAASPQDGA